MKFYKKSLVREVLIEDVCDSLKKIAAVPL